MRPFVLSTLLGLVLVLPVFTPATPANGRPSAVTIATIASPQGTASVSNSIRYVEGSSQKVCQLVGEMDKELSVPTLNQTATRFGLLGNDLGYSFEHDGKLFFLFGDSIPTVKFNGKPNSQNDPPRRRDDNDAIAFTSDTSVDHCLKLDFIHDANGAYKNPVVLNAQGQPAITLGNYEVPIAGISDAGKMYVIFATHSNAYPPASTPGHPVFSSRSVVGVSDDDANTFHYLYDFSTEPDSKFINVAIAQGQDGYLYFWGTQGGPLYRKSPPFLARKPVNGMNSLDGIDYLHGVNPDGTTAFMPAESDATPLFHDYAPDASGQMQMADCMGELGVQWNSFVQRWIMLYNCGNHTSSAPRGIYMRLAERPWGPWSEPQTIFNEARDNGYCHFIHRAVTTQNPTPCDNLSDLSRLNTWGGVYAPYFINRFTNGDAASRTSTFYYTMSTWNPYTEVVMKSTIQVQPQTP